MSRTYSVEYHPKVLPPDHTVHVLIEVDDDVTPGQMVRNMADVGAVVKWFMEIPNLT